MRFFVEVYVLINIENLRGRLQSELRSTHAGLDRVVSQFNLSSRAGIVGFLRMQEAALGQIPLGACNSATRRVVEDLATRARRDLDTLNIPTLILEKNFEGKPDRHALDYVIGGSRLGSQVLKRRWKSAAVSLGGVGTSYMTAPSHLGIWRDFCELASDFPSNTEHADTIVRDASVVFALFRHAADLAYEDIHNYA
ncbi:MAG: hypothetical protein KDJ90_01745 [Nitratireductor sp.]|nr:hypothetical protein [Nitratireductor sp.]